jgi:ABC-type lipoprotein export system ATPase subunit
MAETILQIHHLSKSFGKHEVRRDIDFTVQKGDVVSIIGASGSGKSTLLRCINLLETPTSGQIVYRGDNVAAKNVNPCAYRSHVGMVFQSFNLFPYLSVEQNIEVPMLYARVPRKIRQARALELAKRVKLGHRLGHKPTQLSGGECQRIAIARALSNNPAFILADEPTGNLDEKTSDEIMELFHELHRSGVTIVMVTHNPSLAPHYDKIIRLRDGRIESVE